MLSVWFIDKYVDKIIAGIKIITKLPNFMTNVTEYYSTFHKVY